MVESEAPNRGRAIFLEICAALLFMIPSAHAANFLTMDFMGFSPGIILFLLIGAGLFYLLKGWGSGSGGDGGGFGRAIGTGIGIGAGATGKVLKAPFDALRWTAKTTKAGLGWAIGNLRKREDLETKTHKLTSDPEPNAISEKKSGISQRLGTVRDRIAGAIEWITSGKAKADPNAKTELSNLLSQTGAELNQLGSSEKQVAGQVNNATAALNAETAGKEQLKREIVNGTKINSELKAITSNPQLNRLNHEDSDLANLLVEMDKIVTQINALQDQEVKRINAEEAQINTETDLFLKQKNAEAAEQSALANLKQVLGSLQSQSQAGTLTGDQLVDTLAGIEQRIQAIIQAENNDAKVVEAAGNANAQRAAAEQVDVGIEAEIKRLYGEYGKLMTEYSAAAQKLLANQQFVTNKK